LILLNLGKLGKLKISSPTILELVALTLVLIFLATLIAKWR